jgi:hypothetical protein
MGSTAGAAILVGLIAVLLVSAFIVLWIRDRRRSMNQAADPERADTGPADQDESLPEGRGVS